MHSLPSTLTNLLTIQPGKTVTEINRSTQCQDIQQVNIVVSSCQYSSFNGCWLYRYLSRALDGRQKRVHDVTVLSQYQMYIFILIQMECLLLWSINQYNQPQMILFDSFRLLIQLLSIVGNKQSFQEGQINSNKCRRL